MDCGPTCLRIIAKHYGKAIRAQTLRRIAETNKIGTSLSSIGNVAERIGFKTMGVKIGVEKLKNEAPLPCIILWNQNHYVILYKISGSKFYVSDPAHGLLRYSEEDFIKSWIGSSQDEKGIVLLIQATPKLQEIDLEGDDANVKKFGITYLLHYLKQYKSFITQLIFGVIAGSILQLIFPFLTQGIVDVGMGL